MNTGACRADSRRTLARRGLAGLGAGHAWPAGAIVVGQGAVATTFIVACAVFAAIFFLLVLGLVALATKAPWRARQVRSTLVWYPAGVVAALVVLAGARAAHDDARFETVLLGCIVFLLAGGSAPVGAFFASRRHER